VGKNKKQANFKQPPPLEKRPRSLPKPTFEGYCLSWRFSFADAGGRWAWPTGTSNNSLKQIMDKLPHFERVCDQAGLRAIRSDVATVKLSQAAKQRLIQLQRDDIETLYAWHVGGKERLWCAEFAGMMCILWWDPKHEVYPVPKKYT